MKSFALQNRKPKQESFPFLSPQKKDFGGSLLQGKRKSKRPLSFKKPMHIVLKSTKARGIYSFINHRSKIEDAISSISKEKEIKIYGKAINFNHIHLVVHLSTEENYKHWIRLLPARITESIGFQGNLFDHRPYSKVIEWGRQFQNVMDYQQFNQMEVVGIRPNK